MNILKMLKNGIINENPAFVQVLGMCPTLAVTTGVVNSIGMGFATTAVLIGSNVIISLIKNLIPDKVRIPAFIIVIASFVTIIQFLLEAYLPDLNYSLGVFIPLIVVNCLILARAEAYACKNSFFNSFFDGLGMGIGFTCALVLIGAIREIFGTGYILADSQYQLRILPYNFPNTVIMILPPGAFLTFGIIMAAINNIKRKKRV